MPGILLSGPAGAAKSAQARRLLREATEPTAAADFQAITAALLLQERGPDGRFPLRPDFILPLVEYTRQSVITGATQREINLILTNSDGSPERRAELLERLGPGSHERIIDPGETVVRTRLADALTGVLSDDCAGAIGRWYGRLNRG